MASKQTAVVPLITLYIEWMNEPEPGVALQARATYKCWCNYSPWTELEISYHLYLPHFISNTLNLSLFIRMHSFGSNNIDLINVVLSDCYKYLGKSLLGCIWQDMYFLLHPVGF